MPFKNPPCRSSERHRRLQQLPSLEATIKTILKESEHFSSKCPFVPGLQQLRVFPRAEAAQCRRLPKLPPGKPARDGRVAFWLRLVIGPWKFCIFRRKPERLGCCSLALPRAFVSGKAASLRLQRLLCRTAARAVPRPAGAPAPSRTEPGAVSPRRILRRRAAEDGFRRGTVLLPAGQ